MSPPKGECVAIERCAVIRVPEATWAGCCELLSILTIFPLPEGASAVSVITAVPVVLAAWSKRP